METSNIKQILRLVAFQSAIKSGSSSWQRQQFAVFSFQFSVIRNPQSTIHNQKWQEAAAAAVNNDNQTTMITRQLRLTLSLFINIRHQTSNNED